MSEETSLTAEIERKKVYKMAILVAATFFMENLDATVITTAIPDMAISFSTQPQDLSIGVSAYMLALAVGLPASGWLANRFTARRIFALAVVLFIVASMLCALSTNLTMFTGARLLQGLSGSMMVPVGRTAVLSRTDKKDLVRIISFLVWPGLIAPVIGPVVGGFISQYFSWHWIFFLNLPLGVIALIFVFKLIPSEKNTPRAFDWLGFFVCGLGLLSFVYGLELASKQQASGWYSLGFIGLGILLLLFAGYHLSHTKNPLVSLYSFSKRTFRTTMIGGSLFRIALASAPFLLPLMFQVAFGWSAVKAGSLLLVLFAGNVAMKTITTPMMKFFGFKNILLINGVLVTTSFFLCAFFTPDTSIIWIMVVLFFAGATRSMQFTAFSTLGFSEIEKNEMPGANILFTIGQQINNVLGIVLGALFLSIASLYHHNEGLVLTIADFQLALIMSACLTLLALIDCLLLPKGIGDRVSGHTTKQQKGKSQESN